MDVEGSPISHGRSWLSLSALDCYDTAGCVEKLLQECVPRSILDLPVMLQL